MKCHSQNENKMKTTKTKQAIKIISLLVFCAMFTNCKHEKISKEMEADIVKKCILTFYAKGSTHSYLVSPQYVEFEFNSFFKENKVLEKYYKEYDYNRKKEEVFRTLNWNEKDFKKIQQNINKYNLNKRNPLLLNVSNSKKSQTVYYFSGFYKNLVFGYRVDYCKEIKISDLSSPSFDKQQNFMAASSYMFILKNGNIEKVIDESGITLENVCSD